MNLSGLATGVYPGYVQGQSQLAELAVQQEQANKIKRDQAIAQAQAATLLAAGGNGPPPGGLAGLTAGSQGAPPAPPPQAQPQMPPQGPGQPSVPMQRPGAPQQGASSAGPPAPPQPGGSGLAGLSPGGPPQASPPQQAPTGQPMASGMPPAPPSSQATLQQMAQAIVKANPNIDFKSPQGAQILIGTLEKNQAMLAPQDKADLQVYKLTLDMANKTRDLEIKEQRAQTAQDALSVRQEVEQMRESMQEHLTQLREEGLNQRSDAKAQDAAAALDKRLKDLDDRLDKTIGSREKVAGAAEAGKDQRLGTQEAGRNSRSDAGIASREKLAGTKSRADMVKTATKAGVTVDPAWTDDEIQKHAADAILKKAESTTLTDEQAKYMAEASLSDPSLLSRLGSGPTGNANKTKVLGIIAQTSKPEALAQGRAGMAASTAEGRTAGSQAGRVDLGRKELEKFAPLVLQASSKVNRTQYPSVNALVEAAQKGAGGTDVITLANNLNALKNAYAQVIARGGQVTEGARKQASDLIDKAYSDGQIKAAVAAMLQEAKAAGQAASEVTSDISGKGKPAEAATAPRGAPRIKYDPEGNRIP